MWNNRERSHHKPPHGIRGKKTNNKHIFIVKISKTKGTMKLSMNEAEDLVGRVKADEEGKYLTDHFVKILCAT